MVSSESKAASNESLAAWMDASPALSVMMSESAWAVSAACSLFDWQAPKAANIRIKRYVRIRLFFSKLSLFEANRNSRNSSVY